MLSPTAKLRALFNARGVMEQACDKPFNSEQLRSLKNLPVRGVLSSLRVGRSEQAGQGMLYLRFH